MGIGINNPNFKLIDTTYVIKGIHIGIDNYRSKNLSTADAMWNIEEMKRRYWNWGGLPCQGNMMLLNINGSLKLDPVINGSRKCHKLSNGLNHTN